MLKSQRAGYDLNKDIKFTNNQRILQRIIEGGVLCARQKSDLGGQRKQRDCKKPFFGWTRNSQDISSRI